MFGTTLVIITTIMHIYVFLRLASLPIVKAHLPKKILIVAGVFLWILLGLGRWIGHGGTGFLAASLECIGMTWMATLFLIFVCVLAVDLLTLFGWVLPRISPSLRAWAFAAGLVLSAVALFQGMRPPVIREYTVAIPGLPEDMRGMVIVALADLHLGSQAGAPWLAARVEQVKAQHPDMVVLLGDIFEGHGSLSDHVALLFQQLTPPLGVWAVTGNHEYHRVGNLDLMEKAGFRLLQDRWVEIRPGFVLAGVDDLTSKLRGGEDGESVAKALDGRPKGATVFLSHSPLYAKRAAQSGAGLMLSGHTHGGQIWPFIYLVQQQYPLVAGQYKVGGMTVIVCRGTGNWGPAMRLWYPCEILRITLI